MSSAKPCFRVIGHKVPAVWCARFLAVFFLLSTGPILAQRNFFECPHGIVDGADGTGKCRSCSRATDDSDCARARQTLLTAPSSPWRGNYKAVEDFSCTSAKTFARGHGFQTADEIKAEADSEAAKGINEKVEIMRSSPLRQFGSQPWSDQRASLLNMDLGAMKSRADDLEKEGRKLDDQAHKARRNSDYATSRALDNAAAELRSQASTVRSLAMRAQTEQQNARQAALFDKSRAESAARETNREKTPGEIQTELGSEAGKVVTKILGNAGRNAVMNPDAPINPVKIAVDNTKAVMPLVKSVTDYIEGTIDPKVNQLLNNPNAEPTPRSSRSGGGGYSGPDPRVYGGGSGSGSPATTPPARLPDSRRTAARRAAAEPAAGRTGPA